MRSGDDAAAVRLAERVLERPDVVRGRPRILNMLGIARWTLGDFVGAAAAFELELDGWRRAGRETLQVSAQGNLAEALLCAGDRAGAAHHQRQSMQLALQLGQPLMVVYSMMVAARLAADGEQWAVAARLQTAAEVQLAAIGNVMYSGDRVRADVLLTTSAERLGTAAFEEEQRRGRSDDFESFLTTTDEILAEVASTRLESHV